MQQRGGHRGQSWKEKSKTSMSSSATSSASAVAAEEVSNRIGGLGITENSGQATTQISSAGLSKLFRGNMLENFTVDNSTYTHAQVRATFYPKFENEKSDQEVRSYSHSCLPGCLPNEFSANLIWTMNLSSIQNVVSKLLLYFLFFKCLSWLC